MNTTASRISVINCTSATELYRHYQGQSEPQSAYIALDLEDATLWADYNAEIGSGIPESVFHGRTRRYSIPLLTGDGANQVMADLLPLAQRVLDGSEIEWDGNNHVARLNADAAAAEEAIDARLGNGYGDEPADAHFLPEQRLAVWDIDGAVNGLEADEYDITADTTDERLEEIEREILDSLRDCGEGGVAVCDGLGAYLRQLRTDAASGADDDSED